MLDRLFEAEFPGKDELKHMLSGVKVRTIDEEGSLELRSEHQGTAPVVKTVPVEAEAKDSDGTSVHVLLHTADGRPAELEIYKDDGSRIKSVPAPKHFEITVLDR